MENNNSEKTGRLTPGQIDAVVRISGEISVIENVINNIRTGGNGSRIVFYGASEPIAVKQDKNFVVYDENDQRLNSFVDLFFYRTVQNYFNDLKNRYVSDLESVIRGEGGER